MKIVFKTISIFLLVCTGFTGFAQTPAWYWAKSAGLTGEDFGYSVAMDNVGNTYATGSYTSATITFGSITLTNAGGGDAFLVKYNAAGTVLWAKNIGGAAGEVGHAVAVDAAGNVFVAGWFTSSTLPFVNTTLTALANADIFIAKYDGTGTELWAKSAGGPGIDLCNSLATDAAGNLILTGKYTGATVVFGSTTLTNALAGTNDIFIAQYDAAGILVSAISFGSAGDEIAERITTDALGNLYVTGSFNSTSVLFGSHSVSNSGTGTDMFIAKFDNSGIAAWAKSVGSSGAESGYGIAVDANENVYVTGLFNSSSITIGSSQFTNAGYADLFLVKYDASGGVSWATSIGAEYDEAGLAVAIDTAGNVYITGKYSSNAITFGAITLTNNSVGSMDFFVVKYDPSSNELWALGAGSTGDEMGNDIMVGEDGNVYVVGVFNSGVMVLGPTTIFKGCGNDFFIAVLNNNAVGISEIKGISSLDVFPNPTTGNFNFSCDIYDSQIEIFNEQGKLVHSENCKGYLSSYDISEFSSGTYFFMMTGNRKNMSGIKSTYCGKIIVE